MPESQATQQLAEFLSRIAKLPSAHPDPPQFFANYLQLSVAATGSRGGAIWLIQSGQGPQCYCHIEIELCGLQASEEQKQLILDALQRTITEVKTTIVSTTGAVEEVQMTEHVIARENQCPYPIFFKPLRAAQQVAMVLQLIGSENLNPPQYRFIVGLLDQIAEAGETYLAHRRAAVLEDDRKTLARLLQYAEGVYGSLEPEKVVYQIANLGRDAIGCNRVVVWVDPSRKRGLRAVSGVDKPDRRAVLLQALEKISRHCLTLQKPIVAAREQLKEMDEEDELTPLLHHYFNVSNLDQIFLQPIQFEHKYLGVLIAEGFDPQDTTQIAGIMTTAVRHGGAALDHALTVASMPLMRPLTRLKKDQKDQGRRRKWIRRMVLILLFAVIGSLLPWTIRIDCECELTPAQTRMVDSPLEGVQIAAIEIPAGQVKKGAVIARLNDVELQAQLLMLQATRQKTEVELNQEVRTARKKTIQYELERVQNQINLVQWQIEQCRIRAPIDGTILTPQLELREGITLKRGDQICEIADLNQWQLLLNVPQEEIGWVQRGLAEKLNEPKSSLTVDFYLAAYPEHKIQAEIAGPDQISQTPQIKEDYGNVYEIRVDVSGAALEEIKQGLRTGSTGRAKISTSERFLIYVLLRKVIRFLRVTFF